MNATEFVMDKKCQNCGMTNAQHHERYCERLHIHHVENTGRRNIREGREPDHSRMVILCRSCHVAEDNKNRDYSGRGKKIWETRRKNSEI